jgi:anti-sigma factor RsiW
MREQLPDYLNGTLSAPQRAVIEAHLRACAECTAELETIRLVREVFEPAPAIDVGRIVAALPGHRAVARRPQSWVRRHAYQVAAVVAFVALGGMSLAVARSFFIDTGVVTDSTVVAVDAVESVPLISFAGGLSDLEDDDLVSLLEAMEFIEALPSAEPSAAALVMERQGTS